MNSFLKIFVLSGIFVMHTMQSMNMIPKLQFLNNKHGITLAESSDGLWCVHASKSGSLLCQKDTITNKFVIKKVISYGFTKDLIPVGSNDSATKNRYLIQLMSQNSNVYLIDTHSLSSSSALYCFNQADLEQFNEMYTPIKSAHMSLDQGIIGVFDEEDNELFVSNPALN